MPSCHFLPGIAVAAMTSVEHDGLIWVWAGTGMPALKLPNLASPPGGCGRRLHSALAPLRLASSTLAIARFRTPFGARIPWRPHTPHMHCLRSRVLLVDTVH